MHTHTFTPTHSHTYLCTPYTHTHHTHTHTCTTHPQTRTHHTHHPHTNTHTHTHTHTNRHTNTHTEGHHGILTSCLMKFIPEGVSLRRDWTTPHDEGEWDDNGTTQGELEERNIGGFLQPDVALLTTDSELCEKNSPQMSCVTAETINEHILAVVRLVYKAQLLAIMHFHMKHSSSPFISLRLSP